MSVGSKPVRVVIAEHSSELRQSLSTLIDFVEDFELVGVASSGAEALALCSRGGPDVLLSDLLLPDMDALTALRSFHEHSPDLRVIALLRFQQSKLIPALRDAVFAQFTMDVPADVLIDSIRRAAQDSCSQGA